MTTIMARIGILKYSFLVLKGIYDIIMVAVLVMMCPQYCVNLTTERPAVIIDAIPICLIIIMFNNVYVYMFNFN